MQCTVTVVYRWRTNHGLNDRRAPKHNVRKRRGLLVRLRLTMKPTGLWDNGSWRNNKWCARHELFGWRGDGANKTEPSVRRRVWADIRAIALSMAENTFRMDVARGLTRENTGNAHWNNAQCCDKNGERHRPWDFSTVQTWLLTAAAVWRLVGRLTKCVVKRGSVVRGNRNPHL